MKRILILCFLSTAIFSNSFACDEIRAAFDIGSGVTKLKVYKFNTCTNKIINQVEKVSSIECEKDIQVSYKEDLETSSTIKSSTVKKGINAIKELKSLAKKCGATKFSGVATSAFRQAKNGLKVIETIKAETKIYASIISHQEEAILGFNGALSKTNSKNSDKICVWDIGGSSMQIVCAKDDQKKFFLGKLASVPFKNKIIDMKKNNKNLKSPNPISPTEYNRSASITSNEAKKIKNALGDIIQKSKFYGIGGVHYYSVSKAINLKTYTSKDLAKNIKAKLSKTDKQLGGGKYVDTALSNLILVEGLMKSLNISNVSALKVNLTEGLVASKKYWK